MTSVLRTTPLTSSLDDAWDACALASPDAWFWQTTAWIRWATAIAGGAFAGGHSFAIMDGDAVAAICPLNVEERDGERTFAFLGGPIPAPAFAPGLDKAAREEALRLYAATLDAVAGRESVARGSVKMPFTTTSVPGPPRVNPWLRFGYFDLPFATRVIDLRADEADLLKAMRKGHRSDVRRAATRAAVRIWDRDTLTRATRDEYQAQHARDAGRVTRSQATFDLMEEWIRSGQAVLAEAHTGGRPIAFAVVIHYKTGAFYASGCREPEVTDIPASHLVQWEVMRWLKARGCVLYDIGMQFTGPQWFYVPTPKEMSIAAFKRGFGGATVPLVTAERFYSGAAMRRTFEQRVRAYLEATATPDEGGR